MAVFIPGANGISTRDATLQPSEALKDKIFYNANGRQVGTGVFCEERSVLAVNNVDCRAVSNYGIKAHYSLNSGGLMNGNAGSIGYYSARIPVDTRVKCKLPIPTDKPTMITGWTIDGVHADLKPPMSCNYGMGVTIGIGNSLSASLFYLYFVDANYSGTEGRGWYINDVGSHSIEIFYMATNEELK